MWRIDGIFAKLRRLPVLNKQRPDARLRLPKEVNVGVGMGMLDLLRLPRVMEEEIIQRAQIWVCREVKHGNAYDA
jgi:hypothetical protein